MHVSRIFCESSNANSTRRDGPRLRSTSLCTSAVSGVVSRECIDRVIVFFDVLNSHQADWHRQVSQPTILLHISRSAEDSHGAKLQCSSFNP